MSFSDYSSLQTSVASWMARGDLTTNIPDFVTLFETEANRQLRVRQMEVTQSTTPSSGTFPLPSDYLAWKRLTWTGNGATKSLEYVHPSEIADMYPSQPANIPQKFSILGTTDSIGYVKLMPSDSSPVNFTYFQKLSSLSTTTGSTMNWLLTAHPDVYLAGTLTEANVFVKDYDTAAIWKQRRDALLEGIKSLDQKTRGPSRIMLAQATP